MSDRGRFDQNELDHLKAEAGPLSDIFRNAGFKVRGASGRTGLCLCPFHAEKTPSCQIDDSKGRFKCFGCGQNGDHIDALMGLRGLTFIEAIEALGGVRQLSDEDRRLADQRRQEREAQERAARAKAQSSAERAFAAAVPIAGTHAAAYLSAREIPAVSSWTADLRFVAALPYRGYPDVEADDQVDLGAFPAMVAAIRDVDGDIIGLHRTYLDPVRPAKLSPPGDARRNAAKKVLGDMLGGMIRLGPIGETLALGEGIETSRSWFLLHGAESGATVASAVSLGNLAGEPLGYVPHPINPKRRIPNLEPDPDRPGVVLPDTVRRVVLIGDGDSDPATTRARLIVAARRLRDQGRQVRIHVAPDGQDFNDVLRSGGDE